MMVSMISLISFMGMSFIIRSRLVFFRVRFFGSFFFLFVGEVGKVF